MNEVEDAGDTIGRQSRAPAIFAGALVPLAVGEIAILIFMLTAASNSVAFKPLGLGGTALLILPGTLALGALFAFPISCAHVFLMSWLARRASFTDNVISWSVVGPIFTLPLVVLFWDFGGPANIPIFPLLFLGLGLIGGVAAGVKRPRGGTAQEA